MKHFLAAYGGQSIVNPNSGKSDSLFALVCIFLIYLLWSKGMSKKGKPIPRTTLCLVISGLLLIYALLFTNNLCLNISIPLCAITVYRMIKSFKAKRAKIEEPTYYPLYWTSFTIYFIIYSFVISGIIESFLRDQNIIRGHSMLLYALISIPGLLFGYIITLLFFLPYCTAEKQQHPAKRAIYLINLFAGWTVIGWIAIMIWLYTPSKTKICSHNNQQNANERLKYKQLLDELLDSGAISQEEYQRRIGELLNQ